MTSPTPRQLQILRLLASGLCRKEIAYKLKVSSRTIDTHIAELFSKANCTTTASLIFRSVELGWLSVKDPPRCKACNQILPGH